MENSKKLSVHLLVILIVIFSYTYWGYSNPYSFNLSRTAHSHYQYLSDGFLSGHLYLSILPPQELLSLTNPYNPNANSEFRTSTIKLLNENLYATYGFHDMSLYKDHLYLYFGPLPAISFFIPFKLIFGFYPSESLGVLFFLSIAFIMQFLLLLKIKKDYFPTVSEYWVFFCGILLGISNNTPFLLSRAIFYEIAIASAYCAVSLSLFFLYKYFKNINANINLLLFSFCIALSLAGRPNYIFICIALLLMAFLFIILYVPKKHLLLTMFFLIIPSLLVGQLLGLYNYLRFDSLFEFGNTYQLSDLGHGNILPSWKDGWQILSNMIYGFYYYFFQPYYLDYYYDQYNPVRPPFGYLIDHIAGILYTAPFVVLALFIPKTVKNTVRQIPDNVPLKWIISCLIILVTINFLFLILVNGSTQRYITDFLPYLIFLFILSMSLLNHIPSPIKYITIYNVLFFITGGISIYICYRHGLHQQFMPL